MAVIIILVSFEWLYKNANFIMGLVVKCYNAFSNQNLDILDGNTELLHSLLALWLFGFGLVSNESPCFVTQCQSTRPSPNLLSTSFIPVISLWLILDFWN